MILDGGVGELTPPPHLPPHPPLHLVGCGAVCNDHVEIDQVHNSGQGVVAIFFFHEHLCMLGC